MDGVRFILLFALLLLTLANMGIFVLYESTSGAKIDSDKLGDFSSLQSCKVSFDNYMRDLRRETHLFRFAFVILLVLLLFVGLIGCIFLGAEEEVEKKKRQEKAIEEKNAENDEAEKRTYMDTMSYYEDALKTAFEKMDTEMTRKLCRLNREASKVQENFTYLLRNESVTYTIAFNKFTDKWTECNKYFMMRKDQPDPKTFEEEARLFRDDAKMVDSLEKSLKLVQQADAEIIRRCEEQEKTIAEKKQEKTSNNNDSIKAVKETKESVDERVLPGDDVVSTLHKSDIRERQLDCKSESLDRDCEDDSNKKSEDNEEKCVNFKDDSGNNDNSREASGRDLENESTETTDHLVDDSKSDASASDDFIHV